MGNIVLIGGGVFISILVLAVAVKLVEVRRASTWAATRGRIVASRVESRTIKRAGEGSRSGNFARVEFEYRVGNRKLRGNRVSIGEQAADFQVAETLARYPVGREVDVFYDPARPEQAVLERELPPDFSKGITLALLYFGGGTLFAFAYATRGVDWLSSRLPPGTNAPAVAMLAALGAGSALFAWAKRRQAAEARDWNAVAAEIVTAEVESFSVYSADSESMRIRYAPRIVYRYRKDGRDYQGDHLNFGARVSYGSESMARAKLDAFPVGRRVRVMINPANPSESSLEARAGHLWMLWVVSAALLALAWLAAQPALPRI